MILGTQYRAGLGVSTVIPEIDFETKSSAGAVYNAATEKWEALPGAPNGKKWLGVVGAAVYARHPSTDLLCAAYDLKDGRGWRHWRPGLPPPIDLFEHIARGGLIEAWNVGFERWIWTEVCAKRYGWPLPHMLQWRCAMAKSAAFAYPRALALAAAVLQTPTQKDKDGDRLLKKFSMPRNPTKGDKRLWITPEDDPVDGMKLFQYNHTDIVAEAEASVRLPDLVGENLTFWQLDQIINVRGAPVDRQGILDCCEVVTQCLAKYNAELLALTGIDSAGKVAQIVGWLHARGVHLNSLDEEAVEAALKWNLPAECRRVLEIRKANGSASVKKVFSMALRMTDDDRMHDLYNFYGARTGRPTGEGPQPTNLPKAGPNVYRCASCSHYFGTHRATCGWCGAFILPTVKVMEWNPGAAEDALTVMRGRSLALLEWVFGEALLTVAGCLRGLYKAARGKILISSDYSAIEAVVAAILADVRWRLEVFATHGKIYEASAATAFGVPLEEILEHKKTTGQHHPLRAKGKINELALGYGGWIGALQAFGAPGDEDELKADVLAWRAASPGLEWIWGGQTKGKADGILENAGFGRCWDKWDSTPCLFGIEGAVVQAIQCPDTWFEVTRWDESLVGIAYRYEGTTLYCRLPSGRFLHYHFARLVAQEGRPGWAIEYEGYNSNPLNGGGIGWVTIRTWGSRLFENCVQAIAHDIQRYGMLNLEAAGYHLVLHTYDENVSEVPEDFGSIEDFERIMNTMPPWAVMRDGTPWKISAAGGWRAKRYRKE